MAERLLVNLLNTVDAEEYFAQKNIQLTEKETTCIKGRNVPWRLIIGAPLLAFIGTFAATLDVKEIEKSHQASSTQTYDIGTKIECTSGFDTDRAHVNLQTTLADMATNQDWKVAHLAEQLRWMDPRPINGGSEYSKVLTDKDTGAIFIGYNVTMFGNCAFDLLQAEQSLTASMLIHSLATQDPQGFKDPKTALGYQNIAAGLMPLYFPQSSENR